MHRKDQPECKEGIGFTDPDTQISSFDYSKNVEEHRLSTP
jgi:hypothetical protein